MAQDCFLAWLVSACSTDRVKAAGKRSLLWPHPRSLGCLPGVDEMRTASLVVGLAQVQFAFAYCHSTVLTEAERVQYQVWRQLLLPGQNIETDLTYWRVLQHHALEGPFPVSVLASGNRQTWKVCKVVGEDSFPFWQSLGSLPDWCPHLPPCCAIASPYGFAVQAAEIGGCFRDAGQVASRRIHPMESIGGRATPSASRPPAGCSVCSGEYRGWSGSASIPRSRGFHAWHFVVGGCRERG